MDIFKEDSTLIVASINEITVIQENKKASVTKVNYEPSSVSVSQENHVAIGGNYYFKMLLIKTDSKDKHFPLLSC